MKTTVKKTAAGNRAIPLLTALVLITIVAAIVVFASGAALDLSTP